MSAFWSENVGKCKFSTSKGVLPGKDFLEKAATIKKFKYSFLGKVFEKSTVIRIQIEVMYKKGDKRNKHLKTII